MFGGVFIGATMHIAIGVGERVLVARVVLRKQRKRCADGVVDEWKERRSSEISGGGLPRIRAVRIVAAVPALISWPWWCLACAALHPPITQRRGNPYHPWSSTARFGGAVASIAAPLRKEPARREDLVSAEARSQLSC